MTDPKNLSKLDCATILVNQTLLKSLSDRCHLFEKLLKETRAEMEKINDEQPPDWKFKEF